MAAPTSNDVPGWESFSFDSVSAAGLQNVDVVVDADATVNPNPIPPPPLPLTTSLETAVLPPHIL